MRPLVHNKDNIKKCMFGIASMFYLLTCVEKCCTIADMTCYRYVTAAAMQYNSTRKSNDNCSNPFSSIFPVTETQLNFSFSIFSRDRNCVSLSKIVLFKFFLASIQAAEFYLAHFTTSTFFKIVLIGRYIHCLLYTSPSPRD